MADVSTKEEFDLRFKRIYDEESAETVNDIYSTWSGQYDKDCITHVTYNGPRNGARELASRLGKNINAHILDLGAGTGLVAYALAKLGFTCVDALDANEDMLREAKRRNRYQKYILGYLGKALDIPNDTYDALVCVGTFARRHADETCFEELIRITKPGGFIVFTVGDLTGIAKEIDKKISELESAGLWVLLNPGAIADSQLITDTGAIHGKLYALQKHK